MAIVIGSLWTPRWVRQGEEDDEWKGGLFGCTKCEGEMEGESYKKIEDDICDTTSRLSCDHFEDLHLAASLYLSFATLALVSMIAWVTLCFFFMKGKTGIKRAVVLVLPVFSELFLLVATVCWFAVTNADFQDECEELKDGEGSLCATQGPAVAIFACCYMPFVVAAFFGIYFRRHMAEIPVIKRSIIDSDAGANTNGNAI